MGPKKLKTFSSWRKKGCIRRGSKKVSKCKKESCATDGLNEWMRGPMPRRQVDDLKKKRRRLLEDSQKGNEDLSLVNTRKCILPPKPA